MKQIDVKAPESQDPDDAKRITMLREYTVFNISQCTGLPERIVNPEPQKARNKGQRLELADEFVSSLAGDIRYGGEPYYAPGQDFISMPRWESFRSPEAFYNTIFHEFTHWTGTKHRLDRDLSKRFGTRQYAAEELIAELGAAFLCAEFGFDTTVRSSGYIDNWIQLLEHDNRAFFTAASKASEAAEYLRSLALKELSCPSGTSSDHHKSDAHPPSWLRH